MRHALFGLIVMLAAPLAATASAPPPAARNAAVVLLGEVHDNPAHHQTQTEWVSDLRPAALVFEMLTPQQAAAATPTTRRDAETLEQALDWATSGWPAFSLYFPIFAAAPTAKIYGAAVPRAQARAALVQGVADSFGDKAEIYGLTQALPPAQQQQRETMQALSHCNALPAEMLPGMVDVQRLRDAVLARATLQALDETAGLVVVITGNGHARNDWGVPAYLLRLRPDLTVFALGQSEDGQIEGRFDLVLDAPPVPRDDLCAAFAKD